jgi:hypothetical protein
MDAAEKVGTMSDPLTTEVVNGFPDSASSHVMHAAGKQIRRKKCFKRTDDSCTLDILQQENGPFIPGAKQVQLTEEKSLLSRRIYVSNAAVPPPYE